MSQVSARDNHGDVVEGPAVCDFLTRQSIQAIAIAFDLVSKKGAVHDREIDPRSPPAQPEFVKNERILANELLGQGSLQSPPDLKVVQRDLQEPDSATSYPRLLPGSVGSLSARRTCVDRSEPSCISVN